MPQHDFEFDDDEILAALNQAAESVAGQIEQQIRDAWDRAAAKALAQFPQGGDEQLAATQENYIWELIVLGYIDTQGPTQ